MNVAYISKDTRTEQDYLRSSLARICMPDVPITEMFRHFAGLCTLPLSILIYLLMVPPAVAAVTVAELAAIRIPASADSGVTILRARGDSPESLILSAGEVVDRSTKEVLPSTVTFEPAALDVEPGRTYEIKVTVSRIFFEGEAEVDVLSQGAKIGSLVVARAPFAVTLADAQALFRPGEKTAVTLRNDARYPYEVRWMMQIGVHKYCGAGRDCEEVANWSSVNIPPKDGASIEIDPPGGWFDWTGLFSEGTKEATLWLALRGDLPKRALKLTANLQGCIYPGQTLWILTFLTLGALFSLIVRHWVPNTRRKGELKEQIRRIRLKIDGFSDNIGSTLRILAQVERDLLDVLRKSTWTIMPHYETVAARCSQGIAMLERRVDLIEEIDSVYERQRVQWEISLPPSRVEQVEDLLRSASEGLKKAQPSEGEFIAIKAQIDKAKALTELMGTIDPAFGEELAARVRSMRKERRLFEGSEGLLPGLFKVVNNLHTQHTARESANSNTPDDESIPPPLYNLLDYNLLALEVWRDYIWLYEGAVHRENTKIQDELEKKVKPKLLQYLARPSCGKLRQARLLLREFREHIDKEQVWKAVNAGKAEMYIVYEPAEVRYLQLVQFRVGFRWEELNKSGAKEFFVPEWHFDGGPPNRGCWAPSHFFPDDRSLWEKMRDWRLWRLWERKDQDKNVDRKPVYVSFEHLADPTNDTAEQKEKVFERVEKAVCENIPVRKDSSDDRWTRTFSEVVALLVSIFVPLVALVAGAREELAQNAAGGALLVFLLGFSSDALISVFRQRVESSS